MDDKSGPGVPEWVVTYGDMMSLLLTFFIMLVSLSEVVADQKYRAILDSLQRYVGYRSGPLAPPGKSYPLNSLIESVEMLKLGSFTDTDTGHGGVRTKAVEGDDYRVFRTRDATALRVGNPIRFAVGDATLSEDAVSQLQQIAVELGGKPNKIEICGYASDASLPDDSPIPDVMVLMYARAYNVLSYLKREGIAHERMRINVSAVTEAVDPHAEERQAEPDRAEVLILDAFADEFVGPRATLN